ncbi:MAG: PTS sugar transporter subunit IIA [Desulfobulbaceae bacterium]|jgi:PTS system nitrogen regulatory IIA component|nr:PTS sugar transporter subunit IIA [Desulfobulbaceae bacterium]MDY0350167.1 PTS sugar transporter subunit IIA [Desulfobulbaceae bacterium]
MNPPMLQLAEQCILLHIPGKTKESVLREMAEIAHRRIPHIETDIIFNALWEREQIGSTGVGNGVAIPHARIKGLDRILLCFARSLEGISYDALDNQPVYYIFMILCPVDSGGTYLKTLAGASRLLKQPEIRRRLRLATGQQEIVEIFLQGP